MIIGLSAALTGFGLQGESLTFMGVNVIEDIPCGIWPGLVVYQHFEAGYLHGGFILCWLIQSHPQLGAASAYTLDH